MKDEALFLKHSLCPHNGLWQGSNSILGKDGVRTGSTHTPLVLNKELLKVKTGALSGTTHQDSNEGGLKNQTEALAG